MKRMNAEIWEDLRKNCFHKGDESRNARRCDKKMFS
jgi:hypothetical protein